MFTRWIAILGLAFVAFSTAGTVYLYFDGRGGDRALARETQDRRDNIRVATVEQIRNQCRTDNELRRELRTLVLNGRDNLDAYYKRGLITRSEYDETLVDQDEALARLAGKNCPAIIARFNAAASG
jgi:hypothetical protein